MAGFLDMTLQPLGIGALHPEFEKATSYVFLSLPTTSPWMVELWIVICTDEAAISCGTD